MAEPKKKDTKKIVDVAHPGKTAPSDNSKSVIVRHGPMIKDPMVVEGEVAETPVETAKVSTKTGEAVIAPLAESEPAKDSKAKKDKAPELNEEKPGAAPELKDEDDKKTIAVLAEEAAVKKEEAADEKPTEEPSTESPAIPEAEGEEKKPEIVEQPPKDSSEESTAEKQDDKADIGTDEKATTQSVTEADAEELAAQEKHDAEIQKLIDSRTYVLPIKTVEQRRSKKVVIFGVVFSLLLVIAWVDIALDAGLIEISGIRPVTHFFSN